MPRLNGCVVGRVPHSSDEDSWSVANSALSGPFTVAAIGCDALSRDVICRILRGDGMVVNAYETIGSFSADGGSKPDCVIVDLSQQTVGITELLCILKERDVCAVPAIVAGSASVLSVVQFMKDGAADFLSTPFDDGQVKDRVRCAVVTGRCSRESGTQIMAARALLESLTPRERQVLDLLVGGRSNQDAGNELKISRRTVEMYRARIKAKFQTNNFTHVVHAVVAATQPVPKSAGDAKVTPIRLSPPSPRRRSGSARRSSGTSCAGGA